MSFCTQTRDTPYSRATSLLLRPSIVTAVITSRAIDMAHLRVKEGANYVPRQVLTMSCNQSPSSAPHISPRQRVSASSGQADWPSSGPTWAPEPSRESVSAARTRAINWASSAAAIASSDARLLCLADTADALPMSGGKGSQVRLAPGQCGAERYRCGTELGGASS